MKTLHFWCVVSAFALAGCGGGGGGGHGGGGGGGGGGGPPPGAVLTSLSPMSVTAGDPPLWLIVNGSNFVAGGMATISGQPPTPYTWVSVTQIKVLVTSSAIAAAGSVAIKVTSANVAESNSLTLTVKAFTTSACLLDGSYDFVFTGFNSSGPITIAGNFGVDANGNVTGEQDYKDLASTHPAQPITGGTCVNSMTPNEGALTLTTDTGATFSYTYVSQTLPAPGAKGRIASAASNNGISGSGWFHFVPGPTFLSGDLALGLVGSDSSGNRMTLLGRFTDTTAGLAVAGMLSNGLGDTNTSGIPKSMQSITGTVGIPDAYSRSLATVMIGSQPLQLAIYVPVPGLGLVANADSASGSPLLAGFVNGQANLPFGNGSLTAPLIVTSWGGVSAQSVTSLSRASGFNATGGPAGSGKGTFDLLVDAVTSGAASPSTPISPVTYQIDATGRGTASYTIGGKTHDFVVYLDDVNDGYVMDTNDPSAGYGWFVAQKQLVTFNKLFISQTYYAGTWFSPVAASPNTTGVVTFDSMTGMASGLFNGAYTVVDATTGRGTVAVTSPVFGSNNLVFYIINQNLIEAMGSDGVSGDAIAFLNH